MTYSAQRREDAGQETVGGNRVSCIRTDYAVWSGEVTLPYLIVYATRDTCVYEERLITRVGAGAEQSS